MAPWPTAGRKRATSRISRRLALAAKPLQPGERQKRGVAFPFGELAQARVHITAQEPHREIGAQALELRLAPDGGSADERASRELVETAEARRDERIARILARQIAGDADARRQERRQILRRMHRDVDAPVEERLVELLGEEPLAACVREGAIGDAVSACADDDDLDLALREDAHLGEPPAQLMGLRERERAAARAESSCLNR